MKRFPIIAPDGASVVVTQGFFFPEVNPASGQTHDANDIVLYNSNLSYKENQRLSYGSQLVCPVPNAKCVKVWDFGTMNSLGNGVDIEWQEDGYYWRLHFWHIVKENVKEGDSVVEGQVIGFMGNTGDCRPLPTPELPFNGTHLHLRLSRYQKDSTGFGNIKIVSLDPQLYFDIKNPYQGVDNSNTTLDLIPVKWAWAKLSLTTKPQWLDYMLKYIFG